MSKYNHIIRSGIEHFPSYPAPSISIVILKWKQEKASLQPRELFFQH